MNRPHPHSFSPAAHPAEAADDLADCGRPSKTRQKQAMQSLQDLGSALADLSVERIRRLDMPDALRDALLDYKRFNAHEARRRQMQYIGRLMRNIDAEPLQAQLDALNGQSVAEVARQHRIERLRDALLANEQALNELAVRWPGCDLVHLRNLRRNALKERDEERPPRSYRELFRVLREYDGAAAPDAPIESESGDTP